MSGFTDNDPPHSYLRERLGQLIVLVILLLVGSAVCFIEPSPSSSEAKTPKQVMLIKDEVDIASIGLNTLRPISSVSFFNSGSYVLPKRPTVPEIPDGEEPEVIQAIVTAYNATVAQCDSTPFVTASGERVREGIVACPIWLSFGSLIEIDGEVYECQDRMAFVHQNSNRFDIFMWSVDEARTWGKQLKSVKIFNG